MRLADAAAATLVVSGLTLVTAPMASAVCNITYTSTVIDGAVVLQAQEVCTDDEPVALADTPDVPEVDSGLDAICVATAMSVGEDPFAYCDIPPDDPPDITPGMVAAALARVPLPPSSLQVQPPNGRTLVNFDTNFFTETAPFDTTVTLLGQRVDLHIVPAQFGWQFGDGDGLMTEDPGAPYPQLDVTHSYLTKGSVTPSVDTTWTATYRVNGGPWLDVPGSVTIPGPPVQLQVLTATPTLVGYAG